MVGRVAQLVEQRPFKAWVAGSIPAALTKLEIAAIGPPREGLVFLLHELRTVIGWFFRAI
jgi:hypothetical protein